MNARSRDPRCLRQMLAHPRGARGIRRLVRTRLKLDRLERRMIMSERICRGQNVSHVELPKFLIGDLVHDIECGGKIGDSCSHYLCFRLCNFDLPLPSLQVVEDGPVGYNRNVSLRCLSNFPANFGVVEPNAERAIVAQHLEIDHCRQDLERVNPDHILVFQRRSREKVFDGFTDCGQFGYQSNQSKMLEVAEQSSCGNGWNTFVLIGKLKNNHLFPHGHVFEADNTAVSNRVLGAFAGSVDGNPGSISNASAGAV